MARSISFAGSLLLISAIYGAQAHAQCMDYRHSFQFLSQLRLDNTQAIAAKGNYVYVTTADSLEVFDITNPRSPSPRGRLPLAAWRIAVNGSLLFAPQGQAGLDVIDV